MDDPVVNISIEQALQNLDTACANAQGDRKTHMVLMGSLVVVREALDMASINAQSAASMAEENKRLQEQLKAIYADNVEPLIENHLSHS